ncbi:MAG: response regulator transcription factor [Peptostreptococcus porci]|uniref:response regulator transcription factor n=1 Tax=Peptostreptococcus porci TaxID=2652282 RepID=UPI002A74AEE5|nr:response regulator transcription factor [Peptostreptococcus porci]MDY2795139.1 response regulator transcription factor [Peptostreptococcus porci]MDY5479390.1 response regulator transcription factor [Peptostreptococcus porci]
MKILLIEDHKLLADSLKDSLAKTKGFEVLVLKDIRELDYTLRKEEFDVVLMDINLKGLTKKEQGLEISERLIKEYPGIKIVILTGYNLKYYQDLAKSIGCYGFISKEVDTQVLIKKLEVIVDNDKKVFPISYSKIEELSPNEINIIQLYSSGLTREDVAKECFISLRSLAVSLNRIYRKLDVKNYQEMTKKARELGYIDSF